MVSISSSGRLVNSKKGFIICYTTLGETCMISEANAAGNNVLSHFKLIATDKKKLSLDVMNSKT